MVEAQKSLRVATRGDAAVLEAWFAIPLVLAAMTRSLDGTLVSVKPNELMVRAEGQFQTFAGARRVVVERKSTFAGNAAITTKRIELTDLTPGEYVQLQIDAQGRVTRARAVALVERAEVRSVRGSNIVLEDGTTLTIGSILRFVNLNGKPSGTPTVRPGQTVLLFRHPQTRNIYRVAAEPRVRKSAD